MCVCSAPETRPGKTLCLPCGQEEERAGATVLTLTARASQAQGPPPVPSGPRGTQAYQALVTLRPAGLVVRGCLCVLPLVRVGCCVESCKIKTVIFGYFLQYLLLHFPQFQWKKLMNTSQSCCSASHPRICLLAPSELSLRAPSDSHGAPAPLPPTEPGRQHCLSE